MFLKRPTGYKPYCVQQPISTLGMSCYNPTRSQEPGPLFNIKMSSYQYRKSHHGDTRVVRSFISTVGFLIQGTWRHQMETFSALLAICAGNSPVTGEFPSQRPVTWSFDVFLDLHLNKPLNKQSWGWWFETSSHSLWHRCNEDVFILNHPQEVSLNARNLLHCSHKSCRLF